MSLLAVFGWGGRWNEMETYFGEGEENFVDDEGG